MPRPTNQELRELIKAATPLLFEPMVARYSAKSRNTVLESSPGTGNIGVVWGGLDKDCAALSALIVAAVNSLAELVEENEAMRKALGRACAQIETMLEAHREEGDGLRAYFDRYGVEHSDDACPQDDTCECDAHGKLSSAWRQWGRVESSAYDTMRTSRALVEKSRG